MPASVWLFLLQHLNRAALRCCAFFDRLNGCAYCGFPGSKNACDVS